MIPNFLIIAFGFIFSTIFVWNLVTGKSWGQLDSHPADLKNNPRRFWLVQGIIGFSSLFLLYAGFFLN